MVDFKDPNVLDLFKRHMRLLRHSTSQNAGYDLRSNEGITDFISEIILPALLFRNEHALRLISSYEAATPGEYEVANRTSQMAQFYNATVVYLRHPREKRYPVTKYRTTEGAYLAEQFADWIKGELAKE
jgi:hypothetical protein